jgi:hypothetical protein
MKSIKLLFLLSFASMVVLSCGAHTDLATAVQPRETSPRPPVLSPRQAPSLTATPAVFPTAVQAFSFPTWVAEFSNPIIAALESERPFFEDDFLPICIDQQQEWKVCATPEQRIYYQADEYDGLSISELALATARPTLDLQPDLQNGYALLNKGWFFVVPESAKNPYYALINQGALILSLPQGKENKDFWVYNPRFLYKNFAIQFDLQFYETQPDDTFRFQFEQGAGESFAFDLAKNKTWSFRWGAGLPQQEQVGVYEYFATEPVPILILAQGTQCAVYLNRVPLAYVEDCRTDSVSKLSVYAATFHLISKPSYSAAITIDNVKMWNLDQIETLP